MSDHDAIDDVPISQVEDPGEAAVQYAERFGWKVFPVWWPDEDAENGCPCNKPPDDCHPAKHPIGAAVPKWKRDASDDPEQIRAWWSEYPEANVAVYCGPESDLWCLDVDGDDGKKLVAELADEHDTDPTDLSPLTAETGGGGAHLYFKPNGRKLENVPEGERNVGARVEGQYAILPPSRHVEGRYRWNTIGDPAPADEWLVDTLRRWKYGGSQSEIQDADEPPEYLRVGEIREGTGRHNFLLSTAGKLVWCGFDPETVRRWTHDVNEHRCNPPRSEDHVDRIVDDAVEMDGPDLSHEEYLRELGVLDSDDPREVGEEVDSLTFADVPEILADEPEDPDFILNPLAAPGSRMMLYGASGRGKTTAAYQLANAVATGSWWFGFPIQRQGPAMILEADMPAHETIHFVRRMERAGLKHPDIHIAATDAFNILDDEDLNELRAEVDRIGPEVVIVDTADDVHLNNSTNENQNEHARFVLDRLEQAVSPAFLVHLRHARKQGKPHRNSNVSDEDDFSRGSFLGVGEWERRSASSLQIGKRKNASGDLVTQVKIHKSRLGEPARKIVPLAQDDEGTFQPKVKGYTEYLRLIPTILPPNEAQEFVDTVESKNDVYRWVADSPRWDIKWESVKKAWDRRDPGVVGEWEEYVE